VAEQLDLEMIQGDTFRWIIMVQDSAGAPLNLTSYTVRGMIRKAYTDLTPTESFNVAKATQTGADIGKVVLTLTAAETAAIDKGSYKYDVELEADTDGTENNADAYKLYRGSVTMLPEATK
jgi:hypothetical protein